MKKTLFVVLVFLLFSMDLFAGYSETSPGVWTSTPDSASIKLCIVDAAINDTINVSAGTATWSEIITLNKDGLKLIGPGKDDLVITLGTSYPLQSTAKNVRISGFEFNTSSAMAAIDIKNTGWRIDNCRYRNTYESGNNGVFVLPNGTNVSYAPTGLIDNNEIINGKVVVYAAGNFTEQTTQWRNDIVLGSSNAVYVENNIFTMTWIGASLSIDSNRSGRYVFRYNKVVLSGIMAHGLQDIKERGTRYWEIYGNTLSSTNNLTYAAMYLRGGSGIIFDNDATSTVAWNYTIYFDSPRDSTLAACPEPCGKCDGDSQWDINSEGVEVYCRDQIGRSNDQAVWLDQPEDHLPGPEQALSPVYVWNNLNSAGTLASVSRATASQNNILPNRDYYAQGASFDGTSGVGRGVYADRPVTCTTGVAYWVTDQGEWASGTDVNGVDHTGADGWLSKCETTDTWSEIDDTASYKGYTYPHPLTGPNILTNLTGPGISMNESDVVAGGKVITITISGDTFVATAGDDNEITTAILAGLSGSAAWNTNVRDTLTHAHLVRTSDTVLTLTLPACAGYNIIELDTITWTIPGTAITSGNTSIASPSILVYSEVEVGTTVSKASMSYDAGGNKLEYNADGSKLE